MKTIDTPKAFTDEVVVEVRRNKQAIAAEHDYNVDLLLRDLQERQRFNPRLASRIANGESGKGEF